MRWLDISSQRYDGAPLYSWRAELVDWGDEWLVWHTAAGTPISLARSGAVFAPEHRSIAYMWLRRPYYVAADFGRDGAFRRYYCNVVLPPRLDGSRLNFVDLDLDVLVDEGGRTRLLDVSEFEANRVALRYPPDVETLAWGAVAEIERMAQQSLMPFDGCLQGYLNLVGQR